MASFAVTRRLAIAGGVCAGAALLLGADSWSHRDGASPAVSSPTTTPPGPPTTTPPTPAVSATPTTPSPTVSVARTADQLAAKLDAYGHSRNASFGVALYDRRDRHTFRHHGTWRNETLSTVKVLILAAALRRCQESGISLTAQQAAQARAMITQSDNDAASALLTWVGATDVQRVARLFGLTHTVIQHGIADGTPDWWGYSTTTADDLLRLLNAVTWGTDVLTPANRNYLETLMAQVIPIQRWGVCAPPLPANLAWNTKNGWGARDDAYRANSIGHVRGNGRNYTAVILSRCPLDRDYAVERHRAFETVNGVSRILYAAMARPLR